MVLLTVINWYGVNFSMAPSNLEIRRVSSGPSKNLKLKKKIRRTSNIGPKHVTYYHNDFICLGVLYYRYLNEIVKGPVRKKLTWDPLMRTHNTCSIKLLSSGIFNRPGVAGAVLQSPP